MTTRHTPRQATPSNTKNTVVTFLKTHAAAVVWTVALVCIAAALLLFERELLWKAQEMNLFLSTKLFFRQQMVVAGGLLTWAGTWFTQFFYYPWLGVLLLCGWWLVLMWLTKRTFRLTGQWAVLTLVPMALLLITIVDLGYWLYILKLRGHFFYATLGTTVGVGLLWAYRSLPARHYLRTAFIVVCCAAGYPLFGIYALAATLLMGLWSWRLDDTGKGQAAINSVVAIASAVVIPLVFYRYVYHETNLTDIYRVGLPLYTVTESYPRFYLPYGLLALFYAALVLIRGVAIKKDLWRRVAQASILAGTAAGIYLCWFKDENFHRELSMQHCIARLDWQGVLDEAEAQQDEPTRAIVVMRNIALARLGQQGDRMFHFRNGAKPYKFATDMWLIIVGGPLVYYQYGLPNFCTRVSTEQGVEFGWRAEHYKYLARCALLTDEQQLARKYLGILGQTMFFGQWARDMEKLIGHNDLIRNHPDMGFVTHMMHYDNMLTSDQGYVESFIMKRLAGSINTQDPIFQEQTLIASLWTKEIKKFWKHLADYAQLHPGENLPTHYQEAAILFGSLEERKMGNWPFDPMVRENFRHFEQVAPMYEDQELASVRTALYPMFGNTYFFDYYLMMYLPQY